MRAVPSCSPPSSQTPGNASFVAHGDSGAAISKYPERVAARGGGEARFKLRVYSPLPVEHPSSHGQDSSFREQTQTAGAALFAK